MKHLPKSWKRMQQWMKAKRERQALECIIACILRGWDADDWKEVFRRMDEKKHQKELSDRQHQENSGHQIYGQKERLNKTQG